MSECHVPGAGALPVLSDDVVREGRAPSLTGQETVPDDWDTPRRMTRLRELVNEAALWPGVVEWARIITRGAAAMSGGGRSHAEIIADLALRAVQRRCAFRRDPPGVDVFQALGFTLENGGDCEDLAALLVGLLRLCAYYHGARLRAELVWMPVPEAELDHITVQVWCDGAREPEWMEASLKGAKRGEHPRDAARRLASARPELLAAGTERP